MVLDPWVVEQTILAGLKPKGLVHIDSMVQLQKAGDCMEMRYAVEDLLESMKDQMLQTVVVERRRLPRLIFEVVQNSVATSL